MSLPSPTDDPDADGQSELKAQAEHFVYLYRDEQDRVRYIGYGRQTERATSHLVGSHNEGVNQFLIERRYKIEIAGPFDSRETGLAVETALISTLKPDLNDDPGRPEWRFRPLGVPTDFAARLIEPELQLTDFLENQGQNPTPVLFVIVNDSDFDDKRVGYNPARPPTNVQLRERVDRWWQLERFIPAWSNDPQSSPGLLVGVYGSPGRQIVIASTLIDRTGWPNAERFKASKLRVPLIEPVNLDEHSLRGRRISKSAGIMFGGIPSEFFIILGTDGVAIGGNHLRRK